MTSPSPASGPVLSDSSLEDRVFAIERPDPRMWAYYLLTSLVAGPFFVIPLLYYTFRYRTLRKY